MKLYLKIGGEFRLMKLDAASEIALNFTHDNLENPTNYVSENSYSLKLPKCPENNKLFSNFLHLDSVIVSGGYDPTQRMDYMAMSDEGEVISTGTAVVKSIDGDGYKLSLLGSLSHIFSKLLNAGYDTQKAEADSDYYLMEDWLKKRKLVGGVVGVRFVEGVNVINNELVYASWLIDNPAFNFSIIRDLPSLLSSVSQTSAFIASIIGFAPTAQGKYKDFDSNSWVNTGTVVSIGSQRPASPSILPVLCGRRDDQGEPLQSVDVVDGLVEPQIGEYRSYYQQPYIYIFRLWQLFENEFENITGGYKLTLDSRWFNDTNEELARLVFMLPQLYEESSDINSVIKLGQQGSSFSNSLLMPSGYIRTSSNPPYAYSVSGLSSKATLRMQSNWFDRGDTINIEASICVKFENFAYSNSSYDNNSTYYFSGFNPFELFVRIIDNEDNIYAEKKYLVFPEPTDGAITLDTMRSSVYINDDIINHVHLASGGGYVLLTPKYLPWKKGVQGNHDFYIETNLNVAINQSGDYRVEFAIGYENSKAPFVIKGGDEDYYFYNYSTYYPPVHYYEIIKFTGNATVSKSINKRSNSILTMERLFKTVTPFSILLQFSKIHHLLWFVDVDNKNVLVKRAKDAYADMLGEGIVDVSDITDYNEISISPVSWKERKVIFNLEDMECSYVDGYKDRNGRGYGDKEIITKNMTARETKNLLSGGVKSSAMLSQSVVPVSHILALSSLSAMEVVPMPLNIVDGEQANCYYNFYYRQNNDVWQNDILGKWREQDGEVYVIITDDHPIEVLDNTFCWRGSELEEVNSIKCTIRPVLKTVSAEGLSVMFAAVREQYTISPDEPTEYLYEHCWKDYVEEVYNQQNKTVELYMNISNALLAKLRRNPLVQIGNCIYLLMEIKDWTERKQTCKCKLRQIYNLSKLTGQQ